VHERGPARPPGGISFGYVDGVDHIPSMSSVMTPFPYYVEPGDPVRRARELMCEHEVRHLPVLRDHHLVGILTDRDLRRAMDPDVGLPPKDELFVRDLYMPDPFVVDSATPLDDVLDYMAANHIGSALVTKQGRLAGIFTATDACRVYCDHLRKLFPERAGADVA
jgi:acetoin utilization protein AcuB